MKTEKSAIRDPMKASITRSASIATVASFCTFSRCGRVLAPPRASISTACSSRSRTPRARYLSRSLITFAIIRAGEDGWTSRASLIAFVGGVIALVVFVLVQRRHSNPLIDLKLLRSPAFTGATLASLLLTLSAFGSLALISIWLQSVVGLNPLHAGLALLPLAGVAFVVAGFFGRRMNGIHPALPIAGGLLLIGIGELLLLVLQKGSSWPALLPGQIVIGVGVGLSNPPLTSAALAAVPKERSGMASGIINTARQLGLAFGVAILGTVFTSRATHVLQRAKVPNAHGIAQAVSGGQSAAVIGHAPAAYRVRLDLAIHDAFATGLHGAFVLAGVLGVLGAGLCYLLLRHAQTAAWGKPPAAAAVAAVLPEGKAAAQPAG